MNPGAGRLGARLGAVLPALLHGLALAQAAAPQRIEVQGQVISPAEERRQALPLMTVVGREELDAYGDTSVLDVLQRQPGISIDGEQPRMRGLGGGYTQILLNGEPAPPGFSLEQLSPADIERIEIVKGPSAEFGGVAGTINVILRAPPRQHTRLQGPPLAVIDERTQAWGRWQLARSQVMAAWRPVDGARLEVKTGWQDSRGRSRTLYDGQGGTLAAVQRETLSTSDETRRSAGLKLRWPLAPGHVLVAGWDVDARQRHELRRLFEDGSELLTASQGQPFDVQALRQVGFVQDEWAVSPRLSALLGLRSEVLRTRSTGPTGDLQARSALATPVAQFRWALDAKGTDLLRGSVSRSSRAPELSSLMWRYVLNGSYDRFTSNTPLSPDSAGNPLLQPETALALELAVERHLAGGGVLSAGLFHRRIDGLMLDMALEQTYVNAGTRPLEVVYTFPVPLAATLLGRRREQQPDRPAVVARVQPEVGVPDRLLDRVHGGGVMRRDDEHAGLGHREGREVLQLHLDAVRLDDQLLDERRAGAARAHGRELGARVLDGPLHLLGGILEDEVGHLAHWRPSPRTAMAAGVRSCRRSVPVAGEVFIPRPGYRSCPPRGGTVRCRGPTGRTPRWAARCPCTARWRWCP